MDSRKVDVHFDTHIEFVPVLQPLGRRQHSNELTAFAFEVQLICFFKRVFDILIHSLAPVIEDTSLYHYFTVFAMIITETACYFHEFML